MEAVRTSETSVDNHFTRQYNPEDSSEHHTRRRENLKSHISLLICVGGRMRKCSLCLCYTTLSHNCFHSTLELTRTINVATCTFSRCLCSVARYRRLYEYLHQPPATVKRRRAAINAVFATERTARLLSPHSDWQKRAERMIITRPLVRPIAHGRADDGWVWLKTGNPNEWRTT
jgi:hypothetical protein